MDSDRHMTDSSVSPPNSALLSPPESQTERVTRSSRNMPVVGNSANANGKRPRKDLGNGHDTEDESVPRRTAVPATSNAGVKMTIQEHARSGYQWSKAEDEPGYAWMNKKAVDEYNRAMDGLVHREFAIQSKNGDPYDMAEREPAARP